jgi:NodT family efflux transporter outer membrane factor (OMF) lipoprotein
LKMTANLIARTTLLLSALTVALLLTSCRTVGPTYQTPPAPMAPAFKEAPPDGWKEATPSDAVLKGKWWELYNDPDLNALEEQVAISNQNVLQAEAQFREARESIRIARSALFPLVTTSPGISTGRSGVLGGGRAAGETNSFSIPFDFSYQVDLWGSLHRGVTAAAETAQASAAQLENMKLLYQSDLAVDYFMLHGTDGDIDLLERTDKSYEEYLTLTKNRFTGGVATGGDVAQAETQLDTTKAQLIDLEVARAQYEHAVAILIGKPPAALTIPRKLLSAPPPVIPVAVPTTLLERRPDIAAAERTMASQNEQIGIATATLYPALTLSASAGLQGSSLLNLFSWPARMFSVGPGIAQTLYDAGKRKAQIRLEQDAYDATVAAYRQAVLNAFQQVEDNLSTLRILQNEAVALDQAVKAAEDSLTIATAQYKAGTVNYLTVITAQTFALQNERSAVDVLTRRLSSSVQLIEALGGGWDASLLPTPRDLGARGGR